MTIEAKIDEISSKINSLTRGKSSLSSRVDDLGYSVKRLAREFGEVNEASARVLSDLIEQVSLFKSQLGSIVESAKHHNLEIARLENELESERVRSRQLDSQLKVCQVEIDTLSAVVARDRTRVEAETAIEAAKINKLTKVSE